MKKKIFNTIIILAIVAISLVGGLIYAAVSEKHKKQDYPVFYRTQIASAAVRHGIPENTVFAVLHTQSAGNPSYEKEGKVGLYAMTEEKYLALASLADESRDTRLRWSPDVSIELCAAELADALSAFTDKTAAFASLCCGQEKVRKNIASHDGKFVLSETDEYTQLFVKTVLKALDAYNELYPEAPAEQSAGSSAQS